MCKVCAVRCAVVTPPPPRLNLTLFLLYTNLFCHPEDDHHDVEDDGELFFFFLKKEPTVISELVDFGPCVSAEAVKACALIGPHNMAEENALCLGSDLSPGLKRFVQKRVSQEAGMDQLRSDKRG